MSSMKNALLFLALLASLSAAAQPTDSLRYYSNELYRLQREADSALAARSGYQAALAGLKRANDALDADLRRSGNYGWVGIFSGVEASDLAALNARSNAAGFGSFSNTGVRVGIDAGLSRGRLRYSFGFNAVSFGKVKRGAERLDFSLVTFAANVGVNLLHGNGGALYPFAGISYRGASWSYRAPLAPNPAASTPANLRPGAADATMGGGHFGYQGGLGIDLVLHRSKASPAQTRVFAEADWHGAFGGDYRVRYRDVQLNTGVPPDNWGISAGFRFAHLAASRRKSRAGQATR